MKCVGGKNKIRKRGESKSKGMTEDRVINESVGDDSKQAEIGGCDEKKKKVNR